MTDKGQGKTGRPVSYGAIAAGLAAIAAVTLISRKRPRHNFKGDAVLITGGSRGLGLVLARQLVNEGARVAIAARDQEEIARAVDDLANLGGEVAGILCDVRVKEESERAVAKCIERFGRIDLLINDAGIIQAGPLEVQTEADFRDAMDTHFWGPFYTMQAAVKHMRAAKYGRIINISSIGGKIAVPHLTPYCASKFALAGLSSGMGVELAKDNVIVTSIYPGLMRTGSHINADFKGRNEKEFTLFSLMDATPLSSIAAERAARQILDASRNGKAEAIISIQAKIAAKMNALFPEATAAMLATANSFLPGPGDDSTELTRGKDSRTGLSPSFVTSAIDEASQENNELDADEHIN